MGLQALESRNLRVRAKTGRAAKNSPPDAIDAIPQDQELKIYKQGNWLDLCRGPHMRSTNDIGNAPIHNIAYNNRFEMLELFMNYDTNFKLKNRFGMLPHQFAQKKGNSSMVVELKSLLP